jgi:predicted transcriptional regulator
MSVHSLLISIHPKYADKIFAGEKTVELRKVRPNISSGDIVLMYAKSPTMALIGGFEVDKVVNASPSALWRKVNKSAGITKHEFTNYYNGSENAYGIFITKPWYFEKPMALQKLRNKLDGFHPPQSYRYVSMHEARLLGIV